MKKAIIIVTGLALALSGCASGVKIGNCVKDDPRPECSASSTLPASDSPSPTRTKPKPSKKASPTPTQVEPAFKANTYRVIIRTGLNNFLWRAPGDTEWRYADTGGPRMLTGDIVIFQNLDKDRPHSWTSGTNPQAPSYGKLFDSDFLDYKEKYRWVAPAPMCTRYQDRQVNYILGGPIEVLNRDNPKNVCKAGK